MKFKELKIGLIGAGAMGKALATGLINGGINPKHIHVADPAAERLSSLSDHLGILAMSDNDDAVAKSDVVLIAVKPADVPNVLESMSLEGGNDLLSPLWISIAAGVPLKKLQAALPERARVVRAMPNTPALIGAGATAYVVNSFVTESDSKIALSVFQAIGKVWEAPSESLLDAVTGLSGSGPAYVFVLLEALTDAGVRAGLPQDAAHLLATQTVFGAAKLALESGESPTSLKEQVASPGGTTVAGLERLEAGPFHVAVQEAVLAATSRSRELSR